MKELAPIIVQGILMTIDEFYCHQRRELRRWERIGHPIDTITFIACMLFLFLTSPSDLNLWIFGGLSLVSCLVISKDEWQHRELCDGFENWLHALLFMIHPVVLIWAGYLWWNNDQSYQRVILFSLAVSATFLAYQIIYWNWWRRDQQ